jgi:hypothetical protein
MKNKKIDHAQEIINLMRREKISLMDARRKYWIERVEVLLDMSERAWWPWTRDRYLREAIGILINRKYSQ